MNFTPRLGSAIDKAVKHLESAAVKSLPEQALAQAIGYSEDELPSMLRYGVQEGLLAYDARNGIRMWRLGDRKPGEPALAAEAPQASAAAASRTWPGGYSPEPGGVPDRILRLLDERAPFNSETWLTARDIAHAVDVSAQAIYACTIPAVKRGAIRRKDDNGYVRWQLGDGTRPPAAEKHVTHPPADAAVAHAASVEVATIDTAVVTEAAAVISEAMRTREEAAIARVAHRKFICAAFSDGRITIQKGAGAVELSREEALELFEHLAGFMRVPAGRGRG